MTRQQALELLLYENLIKREYLPFVKALAAGETLESVVEIMALPPMEGDSDDAKTLKGAR